MSQRVASELILAVAYGELGPRLPPGDVTRELRASVLELLLRSQAPHDLATRRSKLFAHLSQGEIEGPLGRIRPVE
jgi:hypothetical protein